MKSFDLSYETFLFFCYILIQTFEIGFFQDPDIWIIIFVETWWLEESVCIEIENASWSCNPYVMRTGRYVLHLTLTKKS